MLLEPCPPVPIAPPCPKERFSGYLVCWSVARPGEDHCGQALEPCPTVHNALRCPKEHSLSVGFAAPVAPLEEERFRTVSEPCPPVPSSPPSRCAPLHHWGRHRQFHSWLGGNAAHIWNPPCPKERCSGCLLGLLVGCTGIAVKPWNLVLLYRTLVVGSWTFLIRARMIFMMYHWLDDVL